LKRSLILVKVIVVKDENSRAALTFPGMDANIFFEPLIKNLLVLFWEVKLSPCPKACTING
jgi:hypothetical protein